MPFKNFEYVSQKLFYFLNFSKYREAPQILLYLAYYNVCGEILQINKVNPGVGRDSCKSDCVSEIKLKMFCHEDTKVVNPPISLTLKNL